MNNKVYLVGAGPGDTGLLTLKGKACIEQADIIVYDYLAADELLVVGDSANDVDSARAAGCPVVCVPYGYTGGADVRSLGADAIVAGILQVAESLCLGDFAGYFQDSAHEPYAVGRCWFGQDRGGGHGHI